MKQLFLAVFAVLVGAVLLSSCGKQQSDWKQFISDYEKVVNQYIAEQKEINAGTREAISPELEAQLAEFDKKAEELQENMSTLQKAAFIAEFLKVSARLIEAHADEITDMMESYESNVQSTISE